MAEPNRCREERQPYREAWDAKDKLAGGSVRLDIKLP